MTESTRLRIAGFKDAILGSTSLRRKIERTKKEIEKWETSIPQDDEEAEEIMKRIEEYKLMKQILQKSIEATAGRRILKKEEMQNAQARTEMGRIDIRISFEKTKL